MARTLTPSSSNDYKAIFDVLRANTGRIVENWATSTAKSAYIRGADFGDSEEVRIDRLRYFFEALVEKSTDPNNKKAHEMLKSAIRTEHSRTMALSALVKKQNLLRDVCLYVVEHDLPDIQRVTAKLALDAMIDRSIEGTVLLHEAYSEMRASIARCLPGFPEGLSSFDQGLARFCRNAMDYFEIDFVSLFKYNSVSKELTCQASSAKGLSLSKDSTIFLDSFPIASDTIAHKKTILTEGAPDSLKKKKIIGRLAFIHTISVPLMQGDDVVGLFVLGDNSKHIPFTQGEVAVVDDLGTQLSWVLQSAAMFQQLELRTKAQKLLIDTAAKLQQEIESEEIYRIIGTSMAEIIPCDEFGFYVYDWEKRVGNPAFATGPYASEAMADRDFPVDLGIAGYVARSRRAEIIWDTETDPRGASIPGTPQAHTRMLAVPVIGQKEVLGVIELIRYPPDSFTQEDLEIATLFANHASVALENAKLLKELRRVRDQIELHMDLLTHDIANYTTPIIAYFDSIRSMKDLDPQVMTAVEKTSRQVESMMRLVEMVRTMSRLREAMPKKLRSMDLKKAIDHAIKNTHSYAHGKDLEFSLKVPEGAMMVLADDMLDDIFINLFYSAAMSDRNEKTRLEVFAEQRAERKVDSWWIRVEQPNKAIPNHLKGEVLRMAKTSKSELTGGFGIGLAAAKGIVERYNGSMWVSDIVQGDYTKGCVFNLILPRVH
jgi:GAF domain-containing protein